MTAKPRVEAIAVMVALNLAVGMFVIWRRNRLARLPRPRVSRPMSLVSAKSSSSTLTEAHPAATAASSSSPIAALSCPRRRAVSPCWGTPLVG